MVIGIPNLITISIEKTTALWEYKGGQEDIRKISGKMHRKLPMEKYIRFTYRLYLGLSFVSFNNQNLVHYTNIKFKCIFYWN